MSIEIVLEELLKNNVKLSVREGKLLCKLPDSGIDDELLDLLKKNKEELKDIILKKSKFEKYQAISKTVEMDSYPLTPSQKRFWLLSQFEGGSQAYNMSFVTKLNGELHLPHFEKSFIDLIERHEILRTQFKFEINTKEVRQIILPASEVVFSIDQKDFSGYSDYNEKIESYLTLINEEAFDLEKAPLLRASLIKIAENEYVFLLSMHHIICDGWSMEILVSEIVQHYNNLSIGNENTIPNLGIQYKDYALWLEGEMQKEKYQESEKYWLEKFTGNLPLLNLPSFKQRPPIQTFNGNHLSHTFSEEFTTKIKSFSEENKVTLFTTLMTVVKSLLYRYSGQDDIIVGTPIAGREHPDLESQIGLYVNTLAIRTQINEKVTFADLLQIEKNNLIEAYEHQMYSFDELVEKLNLKRDIKRSVLFDVMVVYQNQSLLNLGNKKEDANNISFEKYNLEQKTSQFDVTFSFSENNNRLELNIEYNTDIYDSSLIERMFPHFDNFSTKSFQEPETLIQKIDYLTDAEKQQVVFDFNNNNVDYPKDKTIIDLFEEQVTKTPNNIAVVFDNKELTYKELNEQANQLAQFLRDKYKINPDDLIGIKLDRSDKMIVVILGILKSGAAYVPIDVTYPIERIEYIENDSNSKVVIDEKVLASFYENQQDYSGLNIPSINTPNDLAYIIYTSGTTGNPKGVMVEHQNLVSRIIYYLISYNLSEADSSLFYRSYCFDGSIEEYFIPLFAGGKIVIVNKDFYGDLYENLIKYIDSNNVTKVNMPPALLNEMLSNSTYNEQLCNLKSLKHIVSGGDVLNIHHIRNANTKANFYNTYGPTENTIDSTSWKIDVDSKTRESVIGSPVINSQVYILDANLQAVGIGITGTIYVSGTGVSRGYLNRPELTEEKFVSNPFIPNTKMYDTGDLGRWLADGNIEFLGRNDHQVKIRGFRIELGEIENTILQYSEDLKQVVVAIKECGQEKVLVVYLVSTSDVDKSELRSFLQGKLPDYMIPSYFVYLDELPLTSNGKVDRKALPEVTENDVVLKTYVAPINNLEEQILAIINEMTPVNQGKVGVLDNFFEIGLNSLSIVKVAKIIQNDLDIELKVLDLFQFPNVKMLVENLLDKKEEKSETFHENVSEEMDSMVDLF
ncbi:MAG TPA: amino acid adenylation domain-containing protein [Flavobacterium sp.]|nr:amino acid adenylation domain-containing protein [Flavobacterium sp.]